MIRLKQIAINGGRFYRVDIRQMRYFPVRAALARMRLADGSAVEVAYLPFSRHDIHRAEYEARKAIDKAAA